MKMISKTLRNRVPKPSAERLVIESPLVMAVHAGQKDAVIQSLAAGENPNSVDSFGMSCLITAVKKDDPEIVKLLLNAGAKNTKNLVTAVRRKHEIGGWTPLMFAASIGNLEIVRMIVYADENEYRNGGNRTINTTDNEGKTALSIAVDNGYLTVSEFLLMFYANPLIIDEEGGTALDIAIERGYKKLITAMRAITKPIEDDLRLFQTIIRDEVEIAELLLKNNANPNIRDKNWETPLTCAIKHKRDDLDMIRLLLRAGADPNVKDKDGVCPMEIALRVGNESLVELLLQFDTRKL